jgi:hypothetical protein
LDLWVNVGQLASYEIILVNRIILLPSRAAALDLFLDAVADVWA